MKHLIITFGLASTLFAFLATSAPAVAQDVRTGRAAYGDWQTDAPGVTRREFAGEAIRVSGGPHRGHEVDRSRGHR